MSNPLRSFWIALSISLLALSGASAQSVAVEGAPGDRAAVTARQVLARGEYRILDRDTVLPVDTRVTGDVVIVDSRIALEGQVDGAVVVVSGDFFVRPGAVVTGPIALLGGDAFVSGTARTGGLVRLDPRVRFEITAPYPDVVVTLTEPPRPGILRLPGAFGIAIPTYDRVNGPSFGWGGQLAFGADTATLSLDGAAVYRTARRQLDGSVQLRLNPAYRTVFAARATRTTRTNEGWIRGDLVNSLATLLVGSDARDYYQTSELAVFLARTPPPPLVQGERFLVPRFQAAISRDRSLEAAEVWTLFDGSERGRPNPAIDEGTLASLSASALAGWRGVTARFNGGATVEWAPGTIGDFRFAQATAAGTWSMLALRGHQIRIRGFTRLPIGADEAPLQRWTFVGGPGTLPTFDTAAMRGDHALFIHSTYLAPIPRVSLPFVGPTALRLEHAVGAAWRTGTPMPLLEQNLGAGLQASLLYGLVHVDPTDRPLQPVFSVGLELPAANPLPFF